MNILLSGQGFAPPMSYVIIFGCLCLSFMARRSTRVSLALATAITAVVYFGPCVAVIGVVLFIAYGVLEMQSLEADSWKGTVKFTHKFFGDQRFDGWTVEQGASYTHIPSNDKRVTNAMRQTARSAVRIAPYRTHDGIVLRTTVEIEHGEPVIYDHIVTREQFERHAKGGLWNLPSGAVKYNGNELPPMDSFSAKFVDEFNGPETTKVRRK